MPPRKRPQQGSTSSDVAEKLNEVPPPPPDKKIGPFLRFLKHTQGVVTASTTIGVLCLRNTHSLYYVAGALGTGWVAKLLKKVIKQPRPQGSAVTKTHGMPSTHSSTMTFMCLYLALALPKDYFPLQVGVILIAPTVMWSRVQLGLHTPAQTLAGAALGTVSALSLSVLWHGTNASAGPAWLSDGLSTVLVPSTDRWLTQIEGTIRKRVGL
ncbi:PAP2-domain-containing protein [Ceraceosorus guamensis]|uniref:PAP2-domain-containing protein n=1 Tax=Ceraceosorus guamensis TaxID=1522189 RepID=A0A316WE84_9BASI|nr:PAP2-domain-containing protein [Ceraceosorus guamensis]PWN45725.1 PAP2-domain-containing protein [Ceraceosorus guamensis]